MFEKTQPSLLLRLRDTSDQAAWAEFDARYRGLIQAYCAARGLQPSDADDVRQLVMTNLARYLPTFEYRPEKGRFRSYLGCLVRTAIAHYFSRHAGGPAVAFDTAVAAVTPASAAAEQDDLWEQEWKQHHFRVAMTKLRETFDARSVTIFERLLNGDSPEAAAVAEGINAAAVYKIKQRVRDRLKELIEVQVAEEDGGDG